MLSVDSFQFVKLGFSLTHIFYPNQTFCMNNCALEENLIDPPVFARMVVIKSTKKAQYFHLSQNPAICKYPKPAPQNLALMCLHCTGSTPSRLVQDPILMTECPVGSECAVEEDCALVVGEGASELIVGTNSHYLLNIFSPLKYLLGIFTQSRVWTIFTESLVWIIAIQPCMNPAFFGAFSLRALFHSAVYESCDCNAWSMLSNVWYIHIFIWNSWYIWYIYSLKTPGTVGAISSDLYRFSWPDIWISTFFKL